MYLKKWKHASTKYCTRVFIAVLLIIVKKKMRPPKYVSVDEGIISTWWYVCTIEYNSSVRRS